MHINLKAVHSSFIDQIKAALDTEEDGLALIEVARNAYKAEMELASLKKKLSECQDESELLDRIWEFLK